MRWFWIILGIVLVALGALWTLQGLDVIKSGAMAGNTFWAVVGPIVALVGVVLVVTGARSRKAKAQDEVKTQ
jgi:hypothetical protein